jgi:hypothetical protein
MKKIVLIFGLVITSFTLSACVGDFAKVAFTCTITNPSNCN